MRLPEVAVRRPVSTVMVFAGIALLGTVAFFRTNLDMLPDISPPAISVITTYPGASAGDVESEVTKYLEDQLSTLPRLDRLESVSKDNISIVNCIFDWGADLDAATNDIREKVDLATPDMAKSADKPYLFKFSSSTVPVLVLTVSAEESASDLYRIVDKQIADPLKRIAGVGAVMQVGGQERQINVHFDRERLEAYHLSVQQVRGVLLAENLDLPAGTVKVGSGEYQVRVAGRFRDAAEIAGTVVGRQGDGLVRLRDVAEVTDAHQEAQEWAWSRGSHAIALLVQKQSGANTVNVINLVQNRLKELRSQLPSDIRIQTVMDNSEHIYAMLRSLAEAAVVAGILVVVICFLFLRRFRSSLVVTLSIPFSLIGAFIGLYAMGYTLNVVSLMALAIAVGMVVDDAIVVLENIVRHVDQGAEPRAAAAAATSEVGLAVVASTLTIVAVFAPLLFARGLAGIIFSQLAFVILVTILASLLVALTLTPMACSRLLRPISENRQSRLAAIGDKLLEAVDAFYALVLRWALKHRIPLLALLGFLLVGTVALIPLVGTEFMPQVDSGEVSVVIQMAEGTRGEVTADYTTSVLKYLDASPETRASYALAGQTRKGLLSAIGFEEGTNIGRIGGRLLDKLERRRSAEEIADQLRPKVAALPGVEKFSVSAVSSIQQAFVGSGGAIRLDVLGYDLETTDRVAEQVRRIVQQTPGTVDVLTSRKRPRPEVRVRVDRDKAASLGLNLGVVADTLRTNYYGFNDSKFREAGDDFDIELRLKERGRLSISEIGETPLATLTGQTVKLRSIAAIEQTFGPVEIERKNRARVTRVQAAVRGRPLGDVTADIRARIESLELPAGVSLEWAGEAEEQRKAFRDLTLLLVLGIVFVYMIMASQFEDLLDPFVIMFSVPYAFVGVVWAFLLTGTVLNLFTFLGVIMLIGIVVRNAILLVDYTNQLRRRGMDLRDAIVLGGRTRMRPVAMTSLAMIFGMVPLILSKGEGSEIWNALGITVSAGLLVSWLVTLVLIPLVYSLVHEGRLRLSAKREQ